MLESGTDPESYITEYTLVYRHRVVYHRVYFSKNMFFYRKDLSIYRKVLVQYSDRLGVGWEGCRESRRCPRDTYPESYITKYTSIRREKSVYRKCPVFRFQKPFGECAPGPSQKLEPVFFPRQMLNLYGNYLLMYRKCLLENRKYLVPHWEGRYKATWKREFKLPRRKAGLLKSTR